VSDALENVIGFPHRQPVELSRDVHDSERNVLLFVPVVHEGYLSAVFDPDGFLRGWSSVLDIYGAGSRRPVRALLDALPVIEPLPPSLYGLRSDAEALASDWRAVGNDLAVAMKRWESGER
jgi:hypothetical protein